MFHWVILFACVSLCSWQIQSKETSQARISSSTWQTVTSTSRSLPNSMEVKLSVEDENLHLNLEKNLDLESAIPFYVLYENADGNVESRHFAPNTKVTLYQDPRNQATLGIVHKQHDNGTTSTVLKSLLTKGNRLLDFTSRMYTNSDVTEDRSLSHARHLVSDITIDLDLESHNLTHIRGGQTDFVRSARGPRFRGSRYGHTRHKRQVTQDVYIDVIALVDYKIYSKFYSTDATEALNNVYAYYATIFNEVNMLYKGITTLSYTIHVRLIRIQVAMTSSASWTENFRYPLDPEYLDVNATLNNLSSWTKNGINLPAHDAIMLFSGYDLAFNGSPSNAGLAWVSTLCALGDAASVVEDLGGYQSIDTAAHELAHVMGCNHDGDGNSCDPSKGFIMAAGGGQVADEDKVNAWKFSSCSASEMDQLLAELIDNSAGRQCVLNSQSISSEVPSVSASPLGQLFDVDAQCRLVLGSASTMCRSVPSVVAEGVSNVCTNLYCSTGLGQQCTGITAATGTTCGHHRWCRNGECVYDASAPAVLDNCPLGDQPGIAFNGKTCSQMIGEDPGNCYVVTFRKACCSTCAAAYIGIPGCEWGDRNTTCAPNHCSVDANLPVCCQTCNYSVSTTTTTTSPITTAPSITTGQGASTTRGNRSSSTPLSGGGVTSSTAGERENGNNTGDAVGLSPTSLFLVAFVSVVSMVTTHL